MKTYMTPEEHARLHRRRARQTLGLLIAVLALVGIVTAVSYTHLSRSTRMPVRVISASTCASGNSMLL